MKPAKSLDLFGNSTFVGTAAEPSTNILRTIRNRMLPSDKLTFQMADSCPERARLSKPVIDAISATYRIKAEWEKAKENRSENAGALAVELQKAREGERAAERALREHVEQHRCQS